jgi:hypothetical protein
MVRLGLRPDAVNIMSAQRGGTSCRLFFYSMLLPGQWQRLWQKQPDFFSLFVPSSYINITLLVLSNLSPINKGAYNKFTVGWVYTHHEGIVVEVDERGIILSPRLSSFD